MSEQPEDRPAGEPKPMRTRRTVEPVPRETPVPQRTPTRGVVPARPQKRAPRRPPPVPPEPISNEPPQYVLPAGPHEVLEPAPGRSPRESGLYFPWWSVVGLVIVVGVLSCGLWVLIYSAGGTAPPGGRTPTIIITTATATMGMAATLPPTASPTVTPRRPEVEPTETLPPSDIEMGIGARVEIVGTGEAGLSMREGPGTAYTRKGVAHDGAVLVVEDGPQFASGYEWWYVVDPDNPDQAGWSVRQFMQVVAAPEEQ